MIGVHDGAEMLGIALKIVAVCAAGLILYRAEPALNRMSRQTHILVRVSMFLLVVGATAQIGSVVLFGYTPTASEALLLSGVAALLSCERRMRVLIPAPRREIRQ